jgi:hypothetical protein
MQLAKAEQNFLQLKAAKKKTKLHSIFVRRKLLILQARGIVFLPEIHLQVSDYSVQLTVLQILDIIHRSVFYFKIRHFRERILSPSSGGTY